VTAETPGTRPKGMSRPLEAAPSGSFFSSYFWLRRFEQASPSPVIVVPKRRSLWALEQPSGGSEATQAQVTWRLVSKIRAQ